MYSLPANNLSLNSVVDYLWSEAVSVGTQQTYNTGIRCFRTFLAQNNFCTKGSLHVVDENMLILFVAHCFSGFRLRYCTIKLYLNGIRFHYLRLGIDNPLCKLDCNLQRLHPILRAIKRINSSPIRRRLPITFNILVALCTVLRKGFVTPFENLMLEAAFCIAFFGFLRCGELTCRKEFNSDFHLTMGDVTIADNATRIRLHLKTSKTDSEYES